MTNIAEVLGESGVEIFITGFPRSGNTWINRLACDLLNAPRQNLPSEEFDWSQTEIHGTSYVVRKTHWYRDEYTGEGYFERPTKVIWISRDPRDMIVSMMNYRGTKDLAGTINSIEHPLPNRGFRSFIEGWLERPPNYHITYEDLHRDPVNYLAWMYEVITGETINTKRIKAIIARHQFSKLQSLNPHSMNKGTVGRWREHFTYDDAIAMEKKYSDILRALGYTTDPNWVDEVKHNG